MKITFTTMMLSEDIELPDDENNFYRQLAKKWLLYSRHAMLKF